MNTLITRTLTLASLVGFSVAASAQSGPAVYPSFIPGASKVTAFGMMNYDVTVPGNSGHCMVPISDSLTMNNSSTVDLSASTSCSAGATSPISTGGEGCQYSGSAQVTPQSVPLSMGSGSGFGFDVVGDSDSLQVVARSKHYLSADVYTVGAGPGAASGTSTADFSIAAPVVISAPFAIAHDLSSATVFMGDAVLSRQDGTLTGSSEMDWRIGVDANRNGLIDPGETIILSGGTGAIGGGVASNGGMLSTVINRGLYVLEVTLATNAGASATAYCEGGPSADQQSGVENVATRVNVHFN